MPTSNWPACPPRTIQLRGAQPGQLAGLWRTARCVIPLGPSRWHYTTNPCNCGPQRVTFATYQSMGYDTMVLTAPAPAPAPFSSADLNASRALVEDFVRRQAWSDTSVPPPAAEDDYDMRAVLQRVWADTSSQPAQMVNFMQDRYVFPDSEDDTRTCNVHRYRYPRQGGTCPQCVSENQPARAPGDWQGRAFLTREQCERLQAIRLNYARVVRFRTAYDSLRDYEVTYYQFENGQTIADARPRSGEPLSPEEQRLAAAQYSPDAPVFVAADFSEAEQRASAAIADMVRESKSKSGSRVKRIQAMRAVTPVPIPE